MAIENDVQVAVLSDLGRRVELPNDVVVVGLQQLELIELGADGVLEWYRAACSPFVKVGVDSWMSFHFLPGAGTRVRRRVGRGAVHGRREAARSLSWRRRWRGHYIIIHVKTCYLRRTVRTASIVALYCHCLMLILPCRPTVTQIQQHNKTSISNGITGAFN